MKQIALIAHDNKKTELLQWCQQNQAFLSHHQLFATGTTGRLLSQTLGLNITNLKSGPLGGDQQIGARIAEGTITMVIFFWDPLEAQPHDPDVKALLRLAVLYNIPIACNVTTADYLISSRLNQQSYQQPAPDFSAYLNRLDKPKKS